MNENDMRTPARPLELFSLGLMSKRQAVEALGLRDYSDLLIALGAAGLPLAILSEAELDAQPKRS